MDLLCLAGSPRIGGNSDILLDKLISGAAEAGLGAEKVYISGLKISPCTSCGKCGETGECVIDDDMRALYPRILEASAIIVATPVYFMGPSAQLKAVIDRCQALWVRRHILKDPKLNKRPGCLIATAARDGKKAFECSKNIVKALFAVLGVEYRGDLCVAGLEDEGAVLKDSKAIERAHDLGKKLK